jgi:hypothetical protein
MAILTITDLVREQNKALNDRVAGMFHQHVYILTDADREAARRYWKSPKGIAILVGWKVLEAIREARGYRGYEYEPRACDALADVVDPAYEWDWW